MTVEGGSWNVGTWAQGQPLGKPVCHLDLSYVGGWTVRDAALEFARGKGAAFVDLRDGCTAVAFHDCWFETADKVPAPFRLDRKTHLCTLTNGAQEYLRWEDSGWGNQREYRNIKLTPPTPQHESRSAPRKQNGKSTGLGDGVGVEAR